MTDHDTAHEGGCTCRAVRYRLTAMPLFVHCCHCRWCQRETGSAFALNAMIETARVELLGGQPDTVDTPSCSGKGQKIVRRSEEHTSELQSLMRISYAVFCLKKKKNDNRFNYYKY